MNSRTTVAKTLMNTAIGVCIVVVVFGAMLCSIAGASSSSTVLKRSVASRASDSRQPARISASRTQLNDPFTASLMHTFLLGRRDNITAALYDMDTGKTYLYRPGVTGQTASIIKVDILATLLHQAQQASRPLDEEDLELATGMIEASNNDDATALWDQIGASSAIAHFNSLVGMTDTIPNTEGYWGETTTTALDQIDLLKHIAIANPLLDNASRSYELGLMEHVIDFDRWGVSNGSAANATVALKNGWVPIVPENWQINSIGYIDGDGRRYLLAVLTSGNVTEDYGIATIDRISALVWSMLAPSEDK